MKKSHIVFGLGLLALSFVVADAVFAQNNLSGAVNQQLGAGAQGADIGAPVDPRVFIADIIKIVLTGVGSVFTFLIILGGYWWLTDRGEEQRVEKAKKTISAAVVGLIVVLISYSITLFVGRLAERSSRGDNTNTPQEVRIRCGVMDAIRGRCQRQSVQ